MDNEATIASLAALAQSTRLDVFRLLARHRLVGLPASEITRELAVLHNTMSSHLASLSRAGLVSDKRHSRSIVYRANLDHSREVMTCLVKDCCGGRAEFCAPLMAEISYCTFP